VHTQARGLEKIASSFRSMSSSPPEFYFQTSVNCTTCSPWRCRHEWCVISGEGKKNGIIEDEIPVNKVVLWQKSGTYWSPNVHSIHSRALLRYISAYSTSAVPLWMNLTCIWCSFFIARQHKLTRDIHMGTPSACLSIRPSHCVVVNISKINRILVTWAKIALQNTDRSTLYRV